MPATTPRPLRSALPTAPRTPPRTPAPRATAGTGRPRPGRRPPTPALHGVVEEQVACGSDGGSSCGCPARSTSCGVCAVEGEARAVAAGPGRVAAAAGRARRRRPPACAAPRGARSPAGGSSATFSSSRSAANRPTQAASRRVRVRLGGPGPNQRPRTATRGRSNRTPTRGQVQSQSGEGTTSTCSADLVRRRPAVGDVDGPRAVRGADPHPDDDGTRLDRASRGAPAGPARARASGSRSERWSRARRPTRPAVVVGRRPPQLQPRAVDVQAEQPAQPPGAVVELDGPARAPAHRARGDAAAAWGQVELRRAPRRARPAPTACRRPARRGPSARSRRRRRACAASAGTATVAARPAATAAPRAPPSPAPAPSSSTTATNRRWSVDSVWYRFATVSAPSVEGEHDRRVRRRELRQPRGRGVVGQHHAVHHEVAVVHDLAEVAAVGVVGRAVGGVRQQPVVAPLPDEPAVQARARLARARRTRSSAPGPLPIAWAYSHMRNGLLRTRARLRRRDSPRSSPGVARRSPRPRRATGTSASRCRCRRRCGRPRSAPGAPGRGGGPSAPSAARLRPVPGLVAERPDDHATRGSCRARRCGAIRSRYTALPRRVVARVAPPAEELEAVGLQVASLAPPRSPARRPGRARAGAAGSGWCGSR